jgi:hypothetical protein
MARKGWIIGGVIAVVAVAGIASSGSGDDSTSDASKPSASQSAPATPKGKPEASSNKSQADQFREFVNDNGTPAEKAAAKHILKVQGADKNNDILDSAEIYTDFTGDMMSGDASSGKLLASAFADWRDSKNGLVTVYNVDGEILSNGNF